MLFVTSEPLPRWVSLQDGGPRRVVPGSLLLNLSALVLWFVYSATVEDQVQLVTNTTQRRPSAVACRRTASLSAATTNGTFCAQADATFSTQPSPGSSRTSRM